MQDQRTINHLKGLVIDGVNQANSGHPGGALSSMDFAYILFTEHLRFAPQDPQWMGRDRFILSAGHESMLLYSMLFAIGWLDGKDLANFRQSHSRTPGHPENFMTPGVECTTGPLGQGAAMSVGFAIANLHLGAVIDDKLFSSTTWALLGDGCMQEDITLGAASLAGHLGLGNLIWFYDKNRKQISGDISRATSDDEAKIFSGFGWHIIEIDGHDHVQIRGAIEEAKGHQNKPTLIIGNTTMAKGTASMEGEHETHGAPLPQEELQNTKKLFGIPEGETFFWPEESAKHFQRNFDARTHEASEWQAWLETRMQDPQFKKTFDQYFDPVVNQSLPKINWDLTKEVATRNAFGNIIESWAPSLPSLVGGSADLEPSNMTEGFAKMVGDFSATNRAGRNFAFGVREFPMSAISNGIALHGGLVPFDATFLSFSDYSRAALRLGSLQRTRVIHEFTHDSFYLGEDGPTHQPIEHVMSLRLIPQMYVMRPADALETEVLMTKALELTYPSSLCLTRQKLPIVSGDYQRAKQAAKGAWVIQDNDDINLIIFASGSEVQLALKVAQHLTTDKVRVVSVPCWELFDEQDRNYREQVMAWNCRRRVSIEAGVTLGWQKFVGHDGLMIGIDHFGVSGPAKDLEKEFGFTVGSIVAKISNHSFNH